MAKRQSISTRLKAAGPINAAAAARRREEAEQLRRSSKYGDVFKYLEPQLLPLDEPSRRAFGTFGLDPDNPFDHQFLLRLLAWLLFPPRRQGGRKKQWDAAMRMELVQEVLRRRKADPALSRAGACRQIAQDKGLREKFGGASAKMLAWRLATSPDQPRRKKSG